MVIFEGDENAEGLVGEGKKEDRVRREKEELNFQDVAALRS
jgi:hypothetical protein